MRKIWFAPFLVASTLVLMMCVVQDVFAAVYPLFLALWSFVGYLIMYIRASWQAELNPGLETLEPSFWSSIYFAWLYATDRKRWKVHTSAFSCIFAAMLGTSFGFLLLFYFEKISRPTLGAYLPSWISGLFLMLTIAILIVKSAAR